MRNFELEVYFSKWEFSAKYHLTASDVQSMSIEQLLSLATDEQRQQFNNQWLGYTETWGAPELRRLIANTYEVCEANNILCFAGAEEGIYAAMRVLLDKDSHAIVVVPNYQAAETIPLEICQVTGVALKETNDWQLDIDEIEAAITPKTKLVSINIPNNPTGATLSEPNLSALVELCRKHNLYLFSDEVYRGLETDESNRCMQIADVYEKGLSLNVLSKAYGFPGLRIGWIAAQDEDVLLKLERYKHYLSICNSAPSEMLAQIVLSNREHILNTNRAKVRANLTQMESFFTAHEKLFDWRRPDGGCIAYPRYLGRNSVEEFCTNLVEQRGVLLLPASIYKSELLAAPEGHFRIGFGRDNTATGLRELERFISDKEGELLP